MTFNSFSFVIYFTIVTVVYYALRHRYRWMWLLAASCYFYMSFIPYYILVLGTAIVVDYSAGIMIERSAGKKRKYYLLFSIITTCIILFIFKYFGFFNDNIEALAKLLDWNYSKPALQIALPVGLSFHTFQSLSYVIEVYRGNQKAEKNFGIYSLYVMFFPQLVAGPIERPQNLLHQFREPKTFDYQRIKLGLFIMLWGMFKKVVIADRLAVYVNIVFGHHQLFHGWPVLIAFYSVPYQIYCDFSGYSEIAIGTAMILGFKLMTNFRMPLTASSIADLWRKWHISLSTWFRDYIYFPLGGSKTSRARRYVNIMIVFLISGVWHGAGWNFIAFGWFSGFCMALENFTLNVRKKIMGFLGLNRLPHLKHFLSVFIVFHLFALSLIFFRASSFPEGLAIIESIFRATPFSAIMLPNLHFSELLLVLFFIISMVIFENYLAAMQLTMEDFMMKKTTVLRWSAYLVLFCCIFAIGNLGRIQFVYFQF